MNKKWGIVLNGLIGMAALLLLVYAMYTKEYFSAFLFVCIVIASVFRIRYFARK